MANIGPTVRKWLGKTWFLPNLQGCTEAAIRAATSRSKTIRTPQFIVHEAKSTYVAKYNSSHPDSPTVTESSFGSPAFAIANEVHIDANCADWMVEDAINECKVVSTMVHEFMHAVSHNATGLQADDTDIFRGPGSYCYMDEIITDLFGYLVYTAMDLGDEFDGIYDTGYLCPKASSDATSVGNQTKLRRSGGAWLSMAFLSPVFDDHRRDIVVRYFHGGSLGTFEQSVEMTELVKGIGKMSSTASNYSLGYSLSSVRSAWGKRVNDNGLLDLQNVDVASNGYKIPVAKAAKLSEVLTPELGSDPEE